MEKKQGEKLIGRLNLSIGQELNKWAEDYHQFAKKTEFLDKFFNECAKNEVENIVDNFVEKCPQIIIKNVSWAGNGEQGGFTVNTHWFINSDTEE